MKTGAPTLVRAGGATGSGGGFVKRSTAEDPGAFGKRMQGFDLGAFGGNAECLGADPKMGGGFREI